MLFTLISFLFHYLVYPLCALKDRQLFATDKGAHLCIRIVVQFSSSDFQLLFHTCIHIRRFSELVLNMRVVTEAITHHMTTTMRRYDISWLSMAIFTRVSCLAQRSS